MDIECLIFFGVLEIRCNESSSMVHPLSVVFTSWKKKAIAIVVVEGRIGNKPCILLTGKLRQVLLVFSKLFLFAVFLIWLDRNFYGIRLRILKKKGSLNLPKRFENFPQVSHNFPNFYNLLTFLIDRSVLYWRTKIIHQWQRAALTRKLENLNGKLWESRGRLEENWQTTLEDFHAKITQNVTSTQQQLNKHLFSSSRCQNNSRQSFRSRAREFAIHCYIKCSNLI